MDPATPPLTFGGGRFEVRGTLGSGGAGVVYRVLDRQLGREVALKHLRQASGRDLYRFKREFRALADIAHPNLVALHELHAADGEWYFTMELVVGVSFIDWVRPGRAAGPSRPRADIAAAALDENRLRDALIQLVDALLAIHRAGKLHRDLKPSNVLVTRHGRLALLDFGLVAGVAEGDPERLAVGTPVYMSPEQASDQPLGEPSDWYAVGAMLYEAITGRRPFEGDSEQVMTRKQSEQPAHPAQLSPRAPPELASLCMALLQVRPTARPGGIDILDLLGATPSASTRAVKRSVAPASFIGRAAEIEQLRAALADARRGGLAVIVAGKSGIGKTALVRRFLRGLGSAVIVVEGRCFEREAVPFKMLDGVVDALTAAILALPAAQHDALAPPELGALARMFPVLLRVPRLAELAAQSPAPADPQELRHRGFRALRALIARLARARPLVLFVDDAHWGDADSAVFLADLIHAPEPGVLILVAYRPEDYLGVVAQLRRPPGGGPRRGEIRELAVSAFTDEQAAALVAQLAADPARAPAVIAAAGGNPLVLSELARAPRLDPETRIDDLVRARAVALAPDARAMLVVSSVAGRPLPVEIAAHAAGVVAGHAAATQLSLDRLATLRQVGEHAILHPAHDHVRAAVLAGLDDAARARWHEALARAFEAVQGPAGLDPQAVVEHWLGAGHPANAAHHAVAAAAKAESSFAFRRAAELYAVAIAHGPWDATDKRVLMRRQAHALVCAGQLDEAAEILGQAAQLLPEDDRGDRSLDRGDPGGRGSLDRGDRSLDRGDHGGRGSLDRIDLERLRVEALLRRGRIDEALPAAERLLAQVGIRLSLRTRAPRLRLAAQWLETKLRGLELAERPTADVPAPALLAIDTLYSISSGLLFADPALGRAVQAELVRAALDAGEPARACLALAQEVCYAAGGGSRNRAAVDAMGERLAALAARLGHPELIGFAGTARGIAAHMGGRWAEARAHLEAGLATLREHGAGVRWELDLGDTYWLATLFYLGEWRELARSTQLLLHDAIERGDPVAQRGLRTGRCHLAWLLQNRPDAAREQLAAAEAELGPGFLWPHAQAVIAAVNLELYTGDAAGAARRLAAVWSDLDRIGCLRAQQVRIELAFLRARAQLAQLRPEPGEERLRPIRAIADELSKEGADWAAGLGHLVRAAAHAWGADAEAARAELFAAEEHLAASGMAGFVHAARLHRGVLDGGAAGIARAAAARDALRDLGAVEPARIAMFLVPWPR